MAHCFRGATIMKTKSIQINPPPPPPPFDLFLIPLYFNPTYFTKVLLFLFSSVFFFSFLFMFVTALLLLYFPPFGFASPSFSIFPSQHPSLRIGTQNIFLVNENPGKRVAKQPQENGIK
uniref:Transmembrane protein n=1 Tax=Trypanosoma vivax (strain Y486) TaxID=1055687 RepID=G0TYI5_TRYVY|nr:hypothetical protein TVY486_0703660 [Trypanosoma vivax Y486]